VGLQVLCLLLPSCTQYNSSCRERACCVAVIANKPAITVLAPSLMHAVRLQLSRTCLLHSSHCQQACHSSASSLPHARSTTPAVENVLVAEQLLPTVLPSLCLLPECMHAVRSEPRPGHFDSHCQHSRQGQEVSGCATKRTACLVWYGQGARWTCLY
jgi:hypothetical protein